jgi:hypothetical protein
MSKNTYKKITRELFNKHMKDKLRKEWKDFSKWKKSYPHYFAYFVDNKLDHIATLKQ